MRPRKRTLALRALTEKQLRSAKVQYVFRDGTIIVDAKAVKATADRQELELRRIQGKEGGRPTKAPSGIETEILIKFSEYWLTRSKKFSFLQAREHARAWVIAEVYSEHKGISEATVRRWVAKVIGRKEAIPKNHRRK